VTIRHKVITAKPGAELRLIGRLPGIFTGEHWFILSPIDGGTRTRVVQGEHYRGILVSFLDGTISAAETSFALHSEALKGISRSRVPARTRKHPVKLAASETGVISAERSFSRLWSETTASRPD
jgi:hypothetical protein